MKSMKYKIGPFELNEKKASATHKNSDTAQIVITKLKKNKSLVEPPTESISTSIPDEAPNSQKVVAAASTSEYDVDELNEIVICDDTPANACIKTRQLTKSNTSLSSTSSLSATTSENVHAPKEETNHTHSSSANSDTTSSSESGFGTTADDENENNSNKEEAVLPPESNSSSSATATNQSGLGNANRLMPNQMLIMKLA